jgi:hypothetical protein
MSSRLLVVLSLAFAAGAVHAGEIYRCIGADGVISYTNIACPDQAKSQRVASYEPEPNAPPPAYAVPSEDTPARLERETELAQARADAYAQAQADFAAEQARADAQADAAPIYQPIYVPYPVSTGRHHGGHHGGSGDHGGGHDRSNDLPYKPTTPIAKIGPNGEWLQH